MTETYANYINVFKINTLKITFKITLKINT